MDIIAALFSGAVAGGDDAPLELAGKVFQKLSSITMQFLTKISSQHRATKRGYEGLFDDPPASEGNKTNSEPVVSPSNNSIFFAAKWLSGFVIVSYE